MNMIKDRKIVANALAVIVGVCFGLMVHQCTRKPVEAVKVKVDTVVVYDTIADYRPQAKDSVVVRWVTLRVPTGGRGGTHVTDDPDTVGEVTGMVHDTVAVDIPITSKHYETESYQAWVSGYEPSLDSIKVYQRTEYITETVTRMKPPARFSVGLQGGYGYGFKSKQIEPYVGIGVSIRIF